jgi:hypothetical protein
VRGHQLAEAIERALALADVETCGRLLHDRESRDEFERGVGSRSWIAARSA